MDVQPLVTIVDDDESVRRALRWLLLSAGYAVSTYGSGADVLELGAAETPACLLLDVRLPDMTGFDLRDALSRCGRDSATVFITGHDDVATGVWAMKSGAEDFLLKPFDDETVLDAVRRAIRREQAERVERRHAAEIGERYDSLTPREHEVCERVVAGRLNKQIAAELGMCEQTVKVHRSRVMRKMRAGSLAELVREVDSLHRAREDALRHVSPVRADRPYAVRAPAGSPTHEFARPGWPTTAHAD